MSCLKFDGKLFDILGPFGTEASVTEAVVCLWATHVLAEADRSRRRPLLVMRLMSLVRYAGAWPDSDGCTRHATLCSTRPSVIAGLLVYCVIILCIEYWIGAVVSGQEKDQAKQIFTSSAASGILTNDLVKILQDEKVSIGA